MIARLGIFGAMIVTSLAHAASYYPPAPPNHSALDTLYIVASTIGMLLLFVLAASLMNARDARRR
jgi:hypothetical protein